MKIKENNMTFKNLPAEIEALTFNNLAEYSVINFKCPECENIIYSNEPNNFVECTNCHTTYIVMAAIFKPIMKRNKQ